MAKEITWANFPERIRGEAFRLLEWARRRWRLLVGVMAAVTVAALGGGLWTWQAARREAEGGAALAQVNQALRKQYPAGFYLPSGEGGEPRPDAIIQEYHQVAERFAGTRAALEAVLRAGHLEYSAGLFDAAVRSYDRYLENRGAPFRGVALLGKGYTLLANGDAAGAVAAFGAAAEAAPRDPMAAEAIMAQGRALESLGKKDEAVHAFTQVTERFPQSAWAAQATERLNALK